MSSEDHFRKLENLFLNGPINAFYQGRIAVSKGAAEISIPVQKSFHHAGGTLHGSVYFKALDDAACFAVSSLVEDVFVVTVSFHTEILMPVVGGEIRAVGKVVQLGSHLCFADAFLYNDLGREIARGSGVFARTAVPLSPQFGYTDERPASVTPSL